MIIHKSVAYYLDVSEAIMNSFDNSSEVKDNYFVVYKIYDGLRMIINNTLVYHNDYSDYDMSNNHDFAIVIHK